MTIERVPTAESEQNGCRRAENKKKIMRDVRSVCCQCHHITIARMYKIYSRFFTQKSLFYPQQYNGFIISQHFISRIFVGINSTVFYTFDFLK